MVAKSVREYMAEIGRKGGEIGGKAGGKRKARGDAEYYRQLRAKGVRKARREK
jgi:hypothetical protein